MLFKKKKPEMDDFGRKVFNGYPCKNFTKYFCIFFRFRKFEAFFLCEKITYKKVFQFQFPKNIRN